MLSQNDFRTLLSTPAPGDGQKRFDLKEIAKFERENQKSSKPKQKKPKSKEDDTDDGVEGKNLYRDRALERRKDENPDYDKDRSELAMQLDVEKSKLMGGNLETTHFVKGLDYTLLRTLKSSSSSSISSSMGPPGIPVSCPSSSVVTSNPVSTSASRLQMTTTGLPLQKKCTKISDAKSMTILGKKIQGKAKYSGKIIIFLFTLLTCADVDNIL